MAPGQGSGWLIECPGLFIFLVIYLCVKGIQEAKMHFYRISDSLKNTFSVAVDVQNEFYIIKACIISQFVL